MLFDELSIFSQSERIFAISEDKNLSYKSLFNYINSFSSSISNEQKKVALLSENCVEFVVGLLSLISKGLSPYLLPYKASSEEINNRIDELEIERLFYSPKQKKVVENITKKIETFPINLDEKILENGELVREKIDGDIAAIFQFTSGSTGKAKIAGRTHKSLVREIRNCENVFKYRKTDLIYSPVPFFHAYGLVDALFSGMKKGASFYMEDMIFTKRKFYEIGKKGISVIVSTPPFYKLLVKNISKNEGSFSKLRLCFTAGAKCDDKLVMDFKEKFGFNLTNIYGMTELGTILVSDEENPPLNNLSGKLLNEYNSSFFERDGVKILGIKKPVNDFNLLSEEYHKKNIVDGYYLTGDVGYKSGNYIYLTGRNSTFINVGGEKVDPESIEKIINNLDGVEGTVAVGIEHKLYGEIIGLYIQVKNENTLNEKEVRELLKKKLSNYQMPSNIIITDESIPRSGTGKILRGKIQEFFIRCDL